MPTPQQMVKLLNELHALVPEATHELIETRIDCDDRHALNDHPALVPSSGCYGNQIGLLGVLNGIAGLDGELIEAAYDNNTPNGRERLIGFRLREKKRKEASAAETEVCFTM